MSRMVRQADYAEGMVREAVRTAYREALVDVAQDICQLCRSNAPERVHPKAPFLHADPKHVDVCAASVVHARLAEVGGWIGDWPERTHEIA